MIIVTNTIQVKPGYGDIMRERFKTPKNVHTFPGFVRMELLQTQGLEEHEEYQVCTAWDNKESFDAWVQSDSFKQAHAQRRESGNSEMVIGNKITLHEVIVSHLPALPQES
ncbi:antibiotic biosynthesis monooxygenase [Cohnella silvisoli]|uniref:Antibiotic biosynthesis monooxygenase n=1 Tax=Cohnella silvisoli TaxID=2873699 RepID=A0ABV1KYI9_9BACL|nr:antibiotic biosynthesis monooxygenase [Cohnella silvisoli]MCD9024441.1 antibiotic biosynthesis monooxygenase [Cohnella silvisoli]